MGSSPHAGRPTRARATEATSIEGMRSLDATSVESMKNPGVTAIVDDGRNLRARSIAVVPSTMVESTMGASTATAATGGTEPEVRHAHPPFPRRQVRLLQTGPRVGQPGREGVLLVRRDNESMQNPGGLVPARVRRGPADGARTGQRRCGGRGWRWSCRSSARRWKPGPQDFACSLHQAGRRRADRASPATPVAGEAAAAPWPRSRRAATSAPSRRRPWR